MADDYTRDALLKEVRELRRQVRQLENVNQSNSKLKEQLSSLSDDYKKMNGINRELKAKCAKMENILMLGNTSTLSSLINQFAGFATPIMKQIAVEAHLAEFDKSECKLVADFAHYLSDLSIELQKIVALPTFVISDSASKKQLKQMLNRVKSSISNLGSSLDRFEPDQIRLLCSLMEELQTYLDSFQETSSS